MIPTPFTNESEFQQAFRHGLLELLKQPDLGCFILVCANVLMDAVLYQQLRDTIQARFAVLQKAFYDGALASGELTATEEDKIIFENILALGLDAIPTVQYRRLGHWQCQFNQLRTYRPSRLAARKIETLQQPYQQNAFNFNKPFIQNERLWEGQWQGKQLSWYYNKFPFARYHGILVPERQQQQPQYLSQTAHEFIWALLQECSEQYAGLGIGYNSLGAFASVNHLHFQWFIEPEGFSVMSSQWQHNGGFQPYPLACEHYTDLQLAWQGISACHNQSIAYNLIYIPGHVYIFARRMQSRIHHQQWTSGFSWIELAGQMVVQSAQAFKELTAEAIQLEMEKLLLPGGTAARHDGHISG